MSMSTSVQHPPPASGQSRPLWAALWILAIAVLALGASLVYVETRPADGHTAAAALEPVADPPAAPAPAAAAQAQQGARN